MNNEIRNHHIENINTIKEKSNNTKIIMFSIIIILITILGYLAYNYLNKNKEDDARVTELETYLKENYSKYVIDGSTSLIPLHEALEQKFGQGKEIKHSKTVAAFEDFVDGKIDILLAVDYLDTYFQSAEAKNVEINKKEITKEALVFLKNKNFEIESITIDQIKQIYNKEITDWSNIDKKYAGENEVNILPLYRNEDSGSGMALINLLGKKNINCTDNNCIFINDMGGVINALAYGLENIYGDVMIAYNMYTFTEKQYHNENVTTFKINGVEATDETIYDDEYPVILYNYIYYKNDKAKEFGEKLYEYLMTDVGQKLIMENGYVPLKKQNNANIKNNERNCKDNFVDEICVKNEGYNKEINKYVKISIDNKVEKFEYFDTVEEYIFAKSNISREEFNNLKEFLEQIISAANKINSITEKITFEKQKNGEILLDTGFCGGTACIWLLPNETYFKKSLIDNDGYPYMYNRLIISKDLKTLNSTTEVANKGKFNIPIKDFSNAFNIEE